MPNSTSRHLRISELSILAIGTFTLGLDRYLLTGLLPQISSDLNVTAGAVGQSATLFAVVFAVASPVIASLTEAWERRMLLAIGMAAFLAGLVIQATAGQLPVLLIGSVLASLGAAAYMPTAYSTAGLRSDPLHRARALAVVMAGASLALVIGVPLVIRAGQLWGWRPSLWLLAALAIVAILPLWALPSIPAPPISRGRWQIVTDPNVLRVIGLTAAVMTPSFLAVTYLSAILAHEALVPIAMLALGLGGIAGAGAVPFLVNWRGALFAVRVGVCSVTLALAILTVSRESPVGTVMPLFVIGASNAIILIAQNHRLLALVPAASVPFAIGLDGSATFIGGALGAATGGVILATLGTVGLLPVATGIGLLSVMISAAVRSKIPVLIAADT